MNKIVHVIKQNVQEAIVPTTFFFTVFHLLAFTKTLILKAYAVTPTGMAVATIGALIVAKAIVMADKLPFIGLFAGKPLIFSVLWKTAIYAVMGVLFRCIEELIPLLSTHEGSGTAAGKLFSEVSWPQFWALQILLVVALFSYNSLIEIDKHFGAGSVKKAFLG